MAATSKPNSVTDKIVAEQIEVKPRAGGSVLADAAVKSGKPAAQAKRKKDEEDELQNLKDDVGATAKDVAGELVDGQEGPMLLAQAETSGAAESASGGGAAGAGAAAGSAAGAAAGAEGAGAFALSDAALGTMMLAGAVGVAVIASTGGAAAAAAPAAVGFILSGIIALGKINDATGLVIEAFKADGTLLAGGTGTVNNDGTYSISVTENYSGPVLIRLKDTNPGTNYIDEGTGAAADLTTDLRVMVNVSGNGTITVNVTPITELAVRELVGDAGGDGGTSVTTLGATVTTTQVTAANDAIKTALGLTGDIVTTTPVTVDDAAFATSTNTAAKAYGQVLAAIAGTETATGQSTGTVLNTLAQGISGSTLDQAVIDLLITGATTADGVAGNATGTATALTAVIGSNISAIDISADTGSTTDFITQTAAQTITATLDAALTGTKLWGSVDGGTTWTDIGSFVTATSLSWTGVTLSGSSFIKLAVTASTVTNFTGATANVVGNISTQSYSVDATAPAFTSATAANFAENGTATAYTAAATDAHLLTYTKTGADAALFNLDPNSGAVTFISAPNFEVPGSAASSNVYDITVTATDGAGNASSQAVAITVTNANEAPALTGGATSTATLAVNQIFSDNVSNLFSDVDAADVLSYSATGLPVGVTLTTAGVISGTPTTVTPTGGVPVVITATDSGGLTASHTVTVNVVTAPVIASIASNVTQAKSGDALIFTATISEAVAVTGTPTLTLDVGGTTVTATYTGGTGTAALTFTATTPAGDDATVTVTAINLNGGSVIGNVTTQALVTTTTGQVVTAFVVDNSNPVFTSAITANAAENQTAAYTSATTDGTAVTYTLGGTDAAKFNISASTGAVTFIASPNFEAPTDASTNNVYDITVTATDALSHAATQAVAITVTNVNDAPSLTSGATSTTTLAVNQAFSNNASGLFSDVDAGNVFSYSATGLPTGITINPTTGIISGTPTVTGSAQVVVTATDSGGLTASHTVTVDVVSAPTITSTIDNVTNFDVTSNIVLTASGNVTAVAGKNITIVNDGGTGFHGEVTVNTQIIAADDTTKVTITNNTITINPGFDLDLSNNYHITVDAGAFVNAGSVASVAVSDVAAINFSTVTPNDGLLGVASAITNAASQAMDATGNLVASYSWMDIEGVGAPSSANGTVRDLSTGNIAMVFKDYDTTTVAGGAQDGIGAPDLYVSATNFGAGDLLYVDNQLNTQPNNLAISSFFNDTPSNGVTQISFGTGVGGLGGLVEVTPVGAPTPSFVTALELQTLLQTTYIPILSA